MRILFLGDFSENLDEGYKNTSYYLTRELEKSCIVERVNVKKLTLSSLLKTTIRFKPDIIHTIARPTIMSFLVTMLARAFWPAAYTVISALRIEDYLQANPLLFNRFFVSQYRPNLLLVNSAKACDQLIRLGFRTEILTNGVDIERFQPASEGQKLSLRLKHNLDYEKPILLHVGHMIEQRNLQVIHTIKHLPIQMVIVASLYMGSNAELIHSLEQDGVRIIQGYQPAVEEFYKLSDCYLFPTLPGDTLSMPLSVLEAMACNLPVVTTRFNAFVDSFPGAIGLYFFNGAEEISGLLENALDAKNTTFTRDMVKPFSWQSVGSQLVRYYEALQD